MADIRDAYGNPIQLTDEQGYPVQLTDEHGNPVHITGIATSEGDSATVDVPATGLLACTDKRPETVVEHYEETHKVEEVAPEPVVPEPEQEPVLVQKKDEGSRDEVQRATSSSSSSSEDDGQGGRRKKKGLKQKIKEKLTLGGGKHNNKENQATTTTGGEHEKKGMMEKIKDILPGHHNR